MKSFTPILASTSLLICFTFLMAGCGGEESTPAAESTGTSLHSLKTASVSDETADETESTEEPTSQPVAENPTSSKPPEKKPATTGTFSGSIQLTGEIPEIEAFNIPDNALALCNAQGITSESLVVNPNNNGIANVFVYLKVAPEGAPELLTPPDPLVVDQKVCQFIPHAMFITTGSKVNAINSDSLAHNVHTFPIRNQPMNVLLAANDQKGVMLNYEDSEILPHKVGCDIHPWMTAWHLVLDHSYGAVTDVNGEFSIVNLPKGEHEFRIWHERVGYLEKAFTVEITAGEATDATLSYAAEVFTEED